jgi:hypothetical protein
MPICFTGSVEALQNSNGILKMQVVLLMKAA